MLLLACNRTIIFGDECHLAVVVVVVGGSRLALRLGINVIVAVLALLFGVVVLGKNNLGVIILIVVMRRTGCGSSAAYSRGKRV